MRLAIVGAGAVGSVLAGLIYGRAEVDLRLLARGEHLRAMRERGLTLQGDEGTRTVHPHVSDDPAALGRIDIMLITVKAHQLPELAPRLRPMMGPETLVVSVQNGLPWWYFYGSPDGSEPQPFETVDPGGQIWRTFGPERALGGVISVGADLIGPGVVRHRGGAPYLDLGAPRSGDHKEALETLVALLGPAGIDVSLTDAIRRPLWRKQQIAAAFGPTGVLTGAPLGSLQSAPGMRSVIAGAMRECLEVGRAWGVDLENDIEARLKAPMGPPEHRPSMQQDFFVGKPLELDATLGGVIDLGLRRGVATPTLSALLPLVRLSSEIRRQSD